MLWAPGNLAPTKRAPSSKPLLLLRVGGVEAAAGLEDVGGLRVRLRFELLEEVVGREALVAGGARIKAAQGRTAEVGDLLGGHLCELLAVEALPEVLVVLSTIGCHGRRAECANGDDRKSKRLHPESPLGK